MAQILSQIYLIIGQARRPIEQKVLDFVSQQQGSIQDAFKQIFVYYKQLQQATEQLGKIASIHSNNKVNLYQAQQIGQQDSFKKQETIEQLNYQIQDFRATVDQINSQMNFVYKKINDSQFHIQILNRQKQQLQRALAQQTKLIDGFYSKQKFDVCNQSQQQLKEIEKLKLQVQRVSQLYLLAQQQFQKSQVGCDFLEGQLRIVRKSNNELKQQFDQLLQQLEAKQILIISLMKDIQNEPQVQYQTIKSNATIQTNHTVNSRVIQVLSQRIIQQLSQNQADNSIQSISNYQYQIPTYQYHKFENYEQNFQRLKTQDSQNTNDFQHHQHINVTSFNLLKQQLQNQQQNTLSRQGNSNATNEAIQSQSDIKLQIKQPIQPFKPLFGDQEYPFSKSLVNSSNLSLKNQIKQGNFNQQQCLALNNQTNTFLRLISKLFQFFSTFYRKHILKGRERLNAINIVDK